MCWFGHDWQRVLNRYYNFDYRQITSRCRRCGCFKREVLRHNSVWYLIPVTHYFESSLYDKVPLISDKRV